MTPTPVIEEPNVTQPSPVARLPVVLLILALGSGGLYGYWHWRQTRGPAAVSAAMLQSSPAIPAASGPSVGDGDALLRKQAAGLSSAKAWTSWLAANDLLRRLTAAVSLIAEGKSPAPVLTFLAPTGDFSVVRRSKQLYNAPKSTARFDVFAHVVKAIDPALVAKGYVELRPYVDAAYAEIAPSSSSFDRTLHTALDRLTSVPIPAREPELVPGKGITYLYADAKLEAQSPAAKHLLRMGVTNGRAVQTWLKKLSAALAAPNPTSTAATRP